MKVNKNLVPMSLGAILAITGMTTAQAAAPSTEEMWKLIQEQQKTIEMLKAKLEVTDKKVVESEEKIEAATDAIESTMHAGGGTGTQGSWGKKTTIGGYGELHYNNTENDDNNSEKDEVDFHRFVLFFGHQFTDNIRFFSELEVEHSLAGDGKPGEVELEQAWIEFDLNDQHRVRAGLDILPIGIINPTHEPETFFGVERNNIESRIIPATWWEAGIGLNGEVAPGWNYDVVLHSGLSTPTTGGSAFTIRSGRKKVAEAPADDGAVTGRLRYTGIPGLEVGVSAQYQQDITQGVLDIDATLFEAHVDYRRGGWGFRALAARWDLDDGAPVTGPAALGNDEQYGFYLEPSYRFPAPGGLPGEAGIFARYSQWDLAAGTSGSEQEQFDAGLNYWPTERVVFKFDVQQQFGELRGNDNDGFNLGVGYSF